MIKIRDMSIGDSFKDRDGSLWCVAPNNKCVCISKNSPRFLHVGLTDPNDEVIPASTIHWPDELLDFNPIFVSERTPIGQFPCVIAVTKEDLELYEIDEGCLGSLSLDELKYIQKEFDTSISYIWDEVWSVVDKILNSVSQNRKDA